ncbi:MAG: DNA-3-methyladenine glycosylase 2 family protein [Firmicutes bacterium]|nr:DNA-3-methyladenine glycosylase 2 family protein [Bacillota bacterium]
MPIFQYGTREIDYLRSRDEKLGAAIERIGMIEREVIPDPFKAIISSVVGQQISQKAADTVRTRLTNLVGEITPESIVQASIDELRSCGLSARKASYIKGIADAAVSGEVDFANLHTLTDEEIIRRLTSLKGVGIWTAEMVLIFSLGRMDVVSYSDLAIRRGMMKLYGLEELTKEQFNQYRTRYSPYGSVASLYLWRLAGQ